MSKSDVSAVTHLLPTVNEGFISTISSTISPATATIPLNDVTGLVNGSTFVGIIEPGATNQQVFTGTVDTSGLQITGVKWTRGTNVAHAAGATIVDYVTGTSINMITKWAAVEHNDNGTHGVVTATSVSTTGDINATNANKLKDNSTPLSTIRSEIGFDFVAKGCVWAGDSYGSTRAASMTPGTDSANVLYINGRRIVLSNITSRTFTASRDTYVDVVDNGDGTGTVVYTEVTNNAASPALASNSLRIAIIVTGASSIVDVGSINQGQENKVLPIASGKAYSVTDSLGNLICTRDSSHHTLGFAQRVGSPFSTTSATFVDVPELNSVVIVPAGRKIEFNIDASGINVSGTGNIWTIALVEDGTVIQQWYRNNDTSAFNTPVGLHFSKTPTPGTHTYKIQIATSGGTLVLASGATGASPTTAGPAQFKIKVG